MKDKDILTTIVRVKGSNNYDVAPVRSSEAIDKSLWMECSKALSRIYVGPPLNCGDVICKNILNTGVDIICTKKISKDKIY